MGCCASSTTAARPSSLDIQCLRGPRPNFRLRVSGKTIRKRQSPGRARLGMDGNTRLSGVLGPPVLIVVSGRVEDCCRAGENLILSAHARGLGACWVGSPLLWLRTASIKAELGIPPDLMPGAAICLGYPRSIPEAAPREWPTIIWAK